MNETMESVKNKKKVTAKCVLEECPTYAEQRTLFCSSAAPFEDKINGDVSNLKLYLQTLYFPLTAHKGST